jgi:hypothetical protein
MTKETVEELRNQKYRNIDIPKLMPAFMNVHNSEDQRHALDYIENFCINIRDSKSKTVHNMAFYFHSKIDYGSEISENAFIKFLEKKEADNSKGRPLFFEVDYALNICKQNSKELQ